MTKNSQSTKRVKRLKPTKEFVKQEEPNEPTNEFLNQDEAVDRLSALPDKLLLHILSSLDTKEVFRTILLSKRWQFLWTDSSEFHLLGDSSDIEDIRHLVHFVGNMLFMCSGIHLEKFTVNFRFHESFAPYVNLWVQFLVKSKVKDIALHCRCSEKLYVLPQILYSNSSLTNLTIGQCSISPRGAIEWGSLKSLCLDTMELIDTLIEKILAGCPVLSFLRLINCWGFDHLSICSTNLTTLTLENSIKCGTKNGSGLEISAPYVEVLCISGDYSVYYKLKNITSCVKAYLPFKPHLQVIPDCIMYRVQHHLESLHYVKELELGLLYVEIISRLEEKGCNCKLPFSNVLRLTLTAWSHKQSIPGILAILKSSPKLETLVIRGFKVAPHQIHVSRDQPTAYLQNDNLDSVLVHLKTVSISGFTERDLDGEPMLTLVQLLLEKATTLEKMVIGAKDMDASGFSTNFAKMAIKLLSFPRYSRNAVVVIR